MLTTESDNYYYRDFTLIHVSEEFDIFSIEEKRMYLKKEAEKIEKDCRECQSCRVKRFAKVYRGIIYCKCEDEFTQILKEIYQKGRQLGFELDNTVYCMKAVAKMNEREYLKLDVCIPFVS